LVDCGRGTFWGEVGEGFVLWRSSVCVFFVRSFWSLSLFRLRPCPEVRSVF
jgi:hypothetical protein